MVTPNQKNQDSVNSFFKSYFNVVLAVALVIFLAIAYFTVLGPKYLLTLSTIKDEINQKQLLYNSQKKKLADLQAVTSLYKKINPTDLKKFNSVLSDQYVKESLFGEIEDIVTQNGFVVNKIGITMPEDKVLTDENGVAIATSSPLGPNLGEIDIDLSLSTIDYRGFKNLIKIFETNLRLMDISKVNFSAANNTADITLRTYYYKK
jgi:hypothetical protein